MNKKIIIRVLNIIGTLIMVLVILAAVPFLVPKLLGYQLYGVLSESMTPAYSVGGVVYVKECDPNLIQPGDVITYTLKSGQDMVMTHRVIEKNEDERTFLTKGDANNTMDPEPVQYGRVIGKVSFYLPYAADIAAFIRSFTGKCLLCIAFAVSLIFWLIADILTPVECDKELKLDKTVLVQRIGIVIIVISGLYLGFVALRYYRGSSEYEELNEMVVPMSEETPLEKPDDTARNAEDEQILGKVKELHEEYEEVIGWILFDDVDISYPVMQSADNTYYLNHTYSGTENPSGSIFMEAANSPDFQDCHTIIYGHNMKDLSMFGKLRNYKKEGFYEDHSTFRIYTLDQVYRYQIFAYYDIDMDSELYTVGFSPDPAFESFISSMYRHSYLDTGVMADSEDKIVTLSTCSREGERFVLNAKRMDE